MNIDNTKEIAELVTPTASATVPVKAEPTTVTVTIDDSNPDQQMDSDFDLARNTLRGVIQQTDGVLDKIINIASESEHPRAFEVAGQLINTISGVAKDLVGLHKQRKEIISGSDEGGGNVGTQNNHIEKAVFVGSTKDLQEMVKAEEQKNAVIASSK